MGVFKKNKKAKFNGEQEKNHHLCDYAIMMGGKNLLACLLRRVVR